MLSGRVLRRQEGLRQAKSVAVGCDRLRRESHGQEGVDGSSPSEDSTKFLLISPFRSPRRDLS
jgi:hypothetical protein